MAATSPSGVSRTAPCSCHEGRLRRLPVIDGDAEARHPEPAAPFRAGRARGPGRLRAFSAVRRPLGITDPGTHESGSLMGRLFLFVRKRLRCGARSRASIGGRPAIEPFRFRSTENAGPIPFLCRIFFTRTGSPFARSCSKQDAPDGDEPCASLPSIPPSAPVRPAFSIAVTRRDAGARDHPDGARTCRGPAAANRPAVSPVRWRLREPGPGCRDGRPRQLYGLRVGISAARGIGLAAGVPVVGVATLSAFLAPLMAGDSRRPVHQRHRRQARPYLHPGDRVRAARSSSRRR